VECPKCKAEVSGKFCRRCGSAAPLRPSPATPGDLCPSCGGRIGPGAKFCRNCGTPLTRSVGQSAVQASEPCPHCGSRLKPGAKFCKSCGAPAPSAGSGPDSARVRVGVPTVPAPVDPGSVSPSSLPAPGERPPDATGMLQPELRIGSSLVSTPPSSVQGAVPQSFREPEGQSTPPPVPASSSGFWGKNKAILLSGVAVLGLVLGGLTYWFVLRKPEVKRGAKKPSVSRPATTAHDKPSASQSAKPAPDNSATQSQPTRPRKTPATGPKKAASEYPGGDSTPAVPVNSGGSLPVAPARDLSGKWQGEYTNHDTNQIAKVSLQISKDSTDLITGTLIFDSEGVNSAACAITGVYNPQTKFLLLKVDHCQGHPPAYLQGKIGFTAVEPTDSRVFGVDASHNSLLNISRQ
jgi:Double zinc ribbon